MFSRVLSSIAAVVVCSLPAPAYAQWVRHTIDNSSRGADGIRLGDVNGDGKLDLTTGWEEGGEVAIYLHPALSDVRRPWPKTVVGRVKSPEDAVFIDLDQDGQLDVVSCCEGQTRSVFLHRLDRSSQQWTTTPIPTLEGKALWMFACPLDVNGDRTTDLVVGAKGNGAQLGWLDGGRWSADGWHPFCNVGWVMSIEARDMDGDSDLDVLYSDRRSSTRGIHWLENPGAVDVQWARHTVGGTDREVMFLAAGDIDGDGLQDMACAVKDGDLLWLQRRSDSGLDWKLHTIAMPQNAGGGKGIAIADIDRDGRTDVVFTCENAGGKHGVGWLSPPANPTSRHWTFHSISGDLQGIKFDLIQMLDVDEDGDLDILTCEERDNLGVIWYENPTTTR